MAGDNPNSTAQRRPEFSWRNLAAATVLSAVLVIVIWFVFNRPLNGAPAPRPQTMAEISQLNQAVELFKQKYGMYPPSRIFLANNLADYESAIKVSQTRNDTVTVALMENSLQLLQRVFPKLDWTGQSGPIDWTGGRVADFKGGILEGDQCLVFFLGGIQVTKDGVHHCIGFAANSRNPTLTDGPRHDPLYEFSSRRLAVSKNPRRGPFFAFEDGYGRGQPYVYFSAYGTRNGYHEGDCATLGIAPYFETDNPKQFVNPNTFQIISAGADGNFGPGGLWAPNQQPVDAATRDNHANFNNGGLLADRH